MSEASTPGARLTAARIAAGYKTAIAFSDKHGVPQATYHLHETGGRGIRVKVAKDYAKWLGNCDYMWILGGVGHGPPMPSAGSASVESDPAQEQDSKLAPAHSPNESDLAKNAQEILLLSIWRDIPRDRRDVCLLFLEKMREAAADAKVA